MASKRFLIVPVDSSAARMPLPGATMARATLLRSARFIDASSASTVDLQAKLDGSRANPKITLRGKTCAGARRNSRPPGRRRRSCDFRIKLALDVALGHLGGGQDLLDLAGLPRGIEFLQPL